MVIAVMSSSGPDSAGGAIGILFLAVIRAGFLITGFVTAMPTGRLVSIAPAAGGQIALCIAAVFLVEVACNWILFSAIDAPGGGFLPVLGLLLSVALPGMLLAAGFCGLLDGGSRQQFVSPLFWGAIGASAICWAFVTGVAQHREMVRQETFAAQRRLEEEQQQRAEEEEFQRKKSAIEQASPDEAEDLEALLAYTATWGRRDLSDLATALIQGSPQRVARLTAVMTEGTNRLEALGMLALEAKSLPADVQAKCWQTVEIFAREFPGELEGEQTDPSLDSLFRPVLRFMDADATARTRHRRELLAVQEVVKKADQLHWNFSLEAMMRLRDIDHPQGQWAEVSAPGTR
jgi:hypothetical protein